MILPSEEFFVPALNVVSADGFFNLLHLPILRKNDHHGSIAFVGHHHDRSLVDRVLINVIAAGSFHHVNLHGGVLVHFEVSFVGQPGIKLLVPLAYQDKLQKIQVSINQDFSKMKYMIITGISLNERQVSLVPLKYI